jgi:hypothetical protein
MLLRHPAIDEEQPPAADVPFSAGQIGKNLQIPIAQSSTSKIVYRSASLCIG